MALVQKALSGKKQKTLIVALAGVLLTTFLVAYFGLFRSSAPPAPPSGVAGVAVSGEKPLPKVPAKSGIDALTELKQSPAWQALQKFGAWPLPSEPKGRADPFIVPPPVTEEELKERAP